MERAASQVLSARQAEIANLIAGGKSNREIAELLYLSERTVETHVAALFNKLSVRSRTELVAAVLRPALAAVPGPAIRTNLPLQPKRLVGRESDVAQIAAMLRAERLVTVSGAGGVGKTRAALQVGWDLAAVVEQPVVWVELASLANAALVATAIARALRVDESPHDPLIETLAAQLRKQTILLIVDNCEHLIGEAARVAEALLRTCPGVRILATSREPLKIAGECVYRLPSLSVPTLDEARALRATGAGAYGAIVLFAERAHAVDQHFAVTDDNAPILAGICRRLDGIPLAIELAAARVKVLPLRTLAERLNQRFHLLTGGSRTALPRHRTMRALLDWSYDLLSVQEQELFDRLSIFAGGCTLAAASAVCTDEGADENVVFELLSSLVDKSLVMVDLDAHEPRYRLSESSAEYAREKLRARDEQEMVARKHAIACLDLAERLERVRDTTHDPTWHLQVESEMENWRAALDWTLGARGDVVIGQRLAGALRTVFGNYAVVEGQRWLRAALELADDRTPDTVVAKLEVSEASLATILGQPQIALDAANRALSRYQEIGDALGIARAKLLAGRSLCYFDRAPEGEALLAEALEIARSIGNRPLLALVLSALGSARSMAADVAAARAHFAEELEIWKTLGSQQSAAITMGNLAEAEFRGGDPHAALRHASDALAIFRASNYAHNVVHALGVMAAYQIALDRYEEARALAREALDLARELQLGIFVIRSLQHVTAVAALRGANDRERAARLLGVVDARLNALRAGREFTEQQEYERVRAALSAALGGEQLATLMAAGASMTEEQALAEAALI